VSSKSLLERLSEPTPLLLDGAMGTELLALGLPPGQAPEAWLLSHPEKVAQVHAAYDRAGAEALYTHSFGANSIRLGRTNLASRVEELCGLAVKTARSAQKTGHWIWGDMGPCGELVEPYGDLPEDLVAKAFSQQARALVHAGADGLVVESHSDLNEARIAARAALQAGAAVVMVTLSFEGPERDYRTLMGQTPEACAAALLAEGVHVVGVNCGRGLEAGLAVVARLRKAFPKARLVAKLNAGLPLTMGGKLVYPAEPEPFARDMASLRGLGVSALGGCCGTTPPHIQALAKELSRTRGLVK